ncbi:MAG TPA: YqgE/AlgH family protein [Bacteroidales bacterium]|nr:YqgE/AlgH family protein [Bacteroidales bacterium]
MSFNDIAPSAGKTLISEPFLKDLYFRRSVVMLAEHTEEGSFGLVLNKPIESRLNDIVDGFTDFNPRLYLGGPVQTDSLFFIHKFGNLIEGSLPVQGNISWGGHIDQIKELIVSGVVKEDDIRFFIGYSGWSAHQLNDELKRNSWVVSDMDMENLMEYESSDMWEKALEKLGGKFREWKTYPADPMMN